jgi:alcohol dehydrogenase (cytochrome c)
VKSLLALVLTAAAPLCAQGLDPAAMLKPPTDTWPMYNGDYSGRRFSTLSRINAANVGSLTLAWAFQTHGVALKSTPLEVNGILYFSVPDHVWAVDARTGRQIWHYSRTSEGDHIGHRGLSMYKGWLYFTTPDGLLMCLDARNGEVRWKTELADPKLGYFATIAPLVVHDRLIVGVSGDVTDLPGYLESRDPATGKLQWRFYTEPKPGQPGAETWPKNGDAMLHGGGMTWMTGTYDPGLNLLYWGTGNPQPVLAGDVRPGDNLYTCSIVALDADTGTLKWYFQTSPHDTHDWDAVQTPVLFDGEFQGRPRKLLAQAARNGYFFLLDRTNGEHLLTTAFAETNWASGIDERGRPVPRKDKEPKPDGTLVNPGSNGSTNWMAPSFDPETGLFYVSARSIWSVFYLTTTTTKPEGWAGRDRAVWSHSALDAIDYKTGKTRWSRDLGDGEGHAGILTTAGKLLFTADNEGNLLALDPATGKTLWHSYGGGRMASCPSTYELDGRQYVLTGVDGVLYAWSLPK